MVRTVGLIILIGAGIALFVWQGAQPRGPLGSPAESETSIPSEDASTSESPLSQQRLGPFSIDGESFSVVLQVMPRPAGPTQETGKTVTAMEIHDSSGAVQYSRSFSYAAESDTFSEAWSVSAQRLSGATGSGLLVTYELDSQPSAPTPENSGWWQLFGVVDGKLTPFSGPVSVQGSLLPASKSDLLQFKVWAHHFRLIFPVSINWTAGKLSPSALCDTCEYQVVPEDLSRREDLTFVLMCPSPAQCETVDRTLVRRDSTIELVAARAGIEWSEGSPDNPATDSSDSMSGQGEIRVGDSVWLKVRIDGKEGWLHNDDDFLALTFPFEQ